MHLFVDGDNNIVLQASDSRSQRRGGNVDYCYSDEFKALKQQYENATMALALIASAAAKADPKGHFLVVSAAKEFNDASTRFFNYGKESK